tara:strand:- start:7380 stop:8753 length:1374 start_codon:yes stop_codon:yes gene_type:complete
LTSLPDINTCQVAIIGLGYVGLPLAVEIAKTKNCVRTNKILKRKVIGFDINEDRLNELRNGIERTLEITQDELYKAKDIEYTNNEEILANADVYIVTVPTPIDSSKKPYLNPLIKASETVGRAIKHRSEVQKSKDNQTSPIVIFESTVFPGATEEICVPIIEKESGLLFNNTENNKGFFCGYSPERINPGDNQHRLINITKITSGSSKEVSVWVDNLYGSIIKAGTHMTKNIKIAEAAKVIENTQRDLNIALVNELAIIFNHIGIDTLDVLEAAGTKWNFLPFKPGLVGGHCIGVDPYYLTYKAEQHGYHSQVVLAGRRINDGMSSWAINLLVLKLAQKGICIGNAEILLLGLTFKENCPDIRNTLVVDLIKSLKKYNMRPTVVDPWVDTKEAKREYQIEVSPEIPPDKQFTAVICAVAHNEFKMLTKSQWQQLIIENGILFDLKGIMPRGVNPLRM